MKKIIYTALTGSYDNLCQPDVIDKSFDYICFSNDIKEDCIGVWKIRRIPFDNNSKTRVSRYVKILPHRVLPDYDYSLYIDANILIKGNELYQRIDEAIKRDVLIAQVNHVVPYWDCIYEEILHAYRAQKVRFYPAFRQFKHLKKEGMPRHYGLFENNIILRKHNDSHVVRISEDWWNEYMAFSKRDQFSLMYIYWKNNYIPDLLFKESQCARNVDFLEVLFHEEKTFNEKLASHTSVSLYERLKNIIHRGSYRILKYTLDYNSIIK